jgi:glycosyltransferase involved in cell wall biosynthesis
MPAVSVLMPVYDAAAYLARAVESILDQTLRDFEFLIYDDGSTDGSIQIVEGYARRDPRIRLHRMPHAGYAVWLREGVAAANAPFVARMDADDIARPTRLEQQLDFLERHPDCCAVGARVLRIDPDGRPIREFAAPLAHDGIERELLTGRGEALPHPAVMLRRAALLAAGSYRPEYEPAEDLDLFLRLAEHGKLANLPELLFEYRQHIRKTSHQRGIEQRRMVARILREARTRRGLEVGEERAPVAPAGDTPAIDYWCEWVRQAVIGGNLATARRYAFAVLQQQPGRLRSWQLLLRALLGVRVEPLKRWLARRPLLTRHPAAGR